MGRKSRLKREQRNQPSQKPDIFDIAAESRIALFMPNPDDPSDEALPDDPTEARAEARRRAKILSGRN